MNNVTIKPISKTRLVLGGILFFSGFCSPALIPAIINSALSDAWKSLLSTILLFGLPELFMFFAVVLLGADGYNYLKYKFFSLLKQAVPTAQVSRARYHTGLVLFITPLIYGRTEPYFYSFHPFYSTKPCSVQCSRGLHIFYEFVSFRWRFLEYTKSTFSI